MEEEHQKETNERALKPNNNEVIIQTYAEKEGKSNGSHIAIFPYKESKESTSTTISGRVALT